MKLYPFFTILFLLALSVSSNAQKSKNSNRVAAIQLGKNFVKKFQSTFESTNYTFDKEDFLRPTDDYEIILAKDRKHFILKPISAQEPIVDNVEVIVIGGVAVICQCGFGAGDDCKFKKLLHSCYGSCGCGIIQIIDLPDILKVESENGIRMPTDAYKEKNK